MCRWFILVSFSLPNANSLLCHLVSGKLKDNRQGEQVFLFLFYIPAQNADDPTDVATLNWIRPSVPKDFLYIYIYIYLSDSSNGMIFIFNFFKKFPLEEME